MTGIAQYKRQLAANRLGVRAFIEDLLTLQDLLNRLGLALPAVDTARKLWKLQAEATPLLVLQDSTSVMASGEGSKQGGSMGIHGLEYSETGGGSGRSVSWQDFCWWCGGALMRLIMTP